MLIRCDIDENTEIQGAKGLDFVWIIMIRENGWTKFALQNLTQDKVQHNTLTHTTTYC